MHGLQDAAGHIQHAIGPSVSARKLPRLKFVKDDSLKKQAIFDAALRGEREGQASEQASIEAIDSDSEISEGKNT